MSVRSIRDYFIDGALGINVIQSGTSITPQSNKIYKHSISANDSISISTSNFSNSTCYTFELWLDMPSNAVSFSFPSGLVWVDGNVPDFSYGSTRYVIVIRWDGSKLLANLAYTEDLA